MTSINITIIVSSIIVFVMFMGIARRSKFLNKLFFPLFLIVLVFGLIIYGYGYALSEPLMFTAIIRTALQVIAMFTGVSNYDVIKDTPLFSSLPGQLLFWSIHLLAFYMTAGAVLSTIGSALLLKNRGFILRLKGGEVDVIYGSDLNALQHAKALLDHNSKAMIVFTNDKAFTDYSSFIDKLGFVLLNPTNPTFEKTLGLKRKNNIQLYCINSSEHNNIQFAKRFTEILADTNKQAHLTIRCSEKALMQAISNNQKQYTSIFTYSDSELTARLVTNEADFVKRIQFNEAGVAQNDLHIVIVGFSTLGQEILSDTIRNTQFEGCLSHYYVIDKDLNDLYGPYAHQNKGLFKEYDITFIPADCRSNMTTEMLQNVYDKIDFVFICVGDQDTNKILANTWRDLVRDDCIIIQCVNNAIQSPNEMSEEKHLYGSDILITKEIDDRAMKVNQLYSNNKDAQTAWKATDEFSRQSSRAMADFVDAYQYILENVPQKNEEVMENLAKTEHLRWSAFHYTKGYQTMSKDMILQRARAREQEIQETGHSDIRISVDRENKLHACLVPWDKLDEISQLVESLSGTPVNYKELDRQNIHNIEFIVNSDSVYEKHA